MYPVYAAIAALLLCLGLPALADEGLLAEWRFDEGSGTTVGDSVGTADGTLSGAVFTPVGQGYAVKLDGVDDFVHFGNPDVLSPAEQISLEAWVFPERVPAAGEPGIVGKGYENYVLTYYVDGHVWWYTGNSGVNCRAPLPTGGWHHVVGTYDGQTMKLYVDGVLASSNQGRAGGIPSGQDFWIGKSQGNPQFTKGAHFQGMVDDVRLYGRALSAEEVLQHYRTTHLTQTVGITAYPYYAGGQVVATLDLRGLGEIAPGTSIVVSLRAQNRARPAARTVLRSPRSWDKPEVTLQSNDLSPGQYVVEAQSVGPDGKPLGPPGSVSITWPERPTWRVADPNVRVLNSLVTELRHERNISEVRRVFRFTNPRDGWVFLRTTADAAVGGAVRVVVPSAGDDSEVIRQDATLDPVAEAMRRLPAGVHEAIVYCQQGAVVKDLVIRAIPEIGYCRVDAGPQLAAYGPCDWPFLEKHILPHINLAVSRGAPGERERWATWRKQGKRWIVETPLPGIGRTEGVSAEEVERAWVENGKVDEPLLDGMIVDEFSAGDDPIWDAWHEGLKRVAARPGFAGKVFYPYCGPLFGAKGSHDFAQTVMDAGWAVALERYLPEQRTESAARAVIHAAVMNTLQEWEKAQPGAVAHTLLVWGFFIAAPPESCNIDPGVDYKAFTDLQMHAIANDPTTFGLYGVTSYLSAYSDEETLRWAAKLYRHYCIEGRTERLTTHYRLPHITNPDFEEGLTGWEVEAAEDESVITGVMPGLSWLEGRYPPTSQGNTYVLLRRSAARPNTLSQTIRELEPGRTYSAKLICADYDDLQAGLSRRSEHALRVEITGADIIADKSFRTTFGSCYSHIHGAFNRDNPAYMNLFNITFRARSSEAQLVISDWLRPGEPGGPAGQKLLANFVEVQPYYEPE